MTTLVTGSAGHLGEALMHTLRAQGRSARGIDIKPSRHTDRTGSIADRHFVREVMESIEVVIHTATLHKPHVATHDYADFVETNITGTLNLLEEAVKAGVKAFVFTSTTSAFGSALSPKPDIPAAWITEGVISVPKNIYGATKTSAESLCELFAGRHNLPVVVLRTSRFFPEADDDPEIRGLYSVENAQANELLYRRVDIEDVVSAHLLAARKAPEISFGRYIVSATAPFNEADLPMLRENAAGVVERLYPEASMLYAARGWTLFPTIDRVYVNEAARLALGWQPRYDFAHVLECLRAGRDFRSKLAKGIGAKGYHEEIFDEGPYPVAR